MAATFRTYLELVRFSHTIFAMPFAIMAAMIALHFGGDPVWQSQPWQWVQSVIGVLLCMVSARTAAMAFNRLVDRTIDAVNPRTASRHLPRGDLQTGEVLCLIVAASVAFVASTLLFLPNWLPLVLSVPVLAWLLGYSYAKRFTMWAHVWLGLALGLAPVAAWIAIRGSIVLVDPVDLLPAVLLGVSVTLWVTGFDTIYACQDAEFDALHGLHSIPSQLGVPRALRLSAILHGMMLCILAIMPGVVPDLGAIYWVSLAAITGILFWEHSIVKPDDLSRVNEAFLNANAVIGTVLLAAIASDLWL